MSNRIPREFINELIARTDIVELIDSRISLKKTGRNYQACCPFHAEKTPSFSVSQQKQFYHCFGCGVSGNAISFLMEYDRVDFIDAVELLAKSLGLTVPLSESGAKAKKYSHDLYSPLEKTKLLYQQALKNSLEAKQYLINRGLTGDIAKKYGLGFDANRHKITFPIHDRRGRVIGFGFRVLDNSLPKYINSPDSPIFHKGTVLYGLYEAREANRTLDKIIVVEGYMDVIALAQAGITDAVATLGTATTEFHVTQLCQHTDKIIFCFDADDAGRKASWRALQSALPVLRDGIEISFLFLPHGEDPDSFIKKQGAAEFLALLNTRKLLADNFFDYVKTRHAINVYSTEGRTKYIHEALKEIEVIAAPVFKKMMIDKLAEIVRLDKSQMNDFVNNSNILSPKNNTLKIQRTPMRLAIALLLQKPDLIQCIDSHHRDFILNCNLPGSDSVKNIMAVLINHNTHLNTGNVLEYFRDSPVEYERLYRLAAWEHGVPEEGMTLEFKEILQHLVRMQREHDIEGLIHQSNQHTLTEEDKKKLQLLLVEKSEKHA